MIILTIYVDVIIIACANLDYVKEVKQQICSRFDMSDMGELKHFLNVRVTRTAGSIKLGQVVYTQKVLDKYSDFLGPRGKTRKFPLPADAADRLAQRGSNLNWEEQQYFLSTLRALYAITVDYEGSQYLGMSIAHDKAAQTISISMPGYVARVLERFHEWAGTRTASTPAVYHAPQYGAKVQIPFTDDSSPLSATDTTTLQAITGSLLYYARAVDPTMLPAVKAIAFSQARQTTMVRDAAIRLLQYTGLTRQTL